MEIILYIVLALIVIVFLYFLIKKSDPNVPDESSSIVRYRNTEELTKQMIEKKIKNNLN